MTFEQYEELRYRLIVDLYEVVAPHKARNRSYVSKDNYDQVSLIVKDIIELLMVYSDVCEDQGHIKGGKRLRDLVEYMKSDHIENVVEQLLEIGRTMAIRRIHYQNVNQTKYTMSHIVHPPRSWSTSTPQP